jgi:hypothetical protein
MSNFFLNNEFEMIDLGEIEFCLGIQVICKRTMKTISLGQRNFIKDILKHFGMAKCRPISTPLGDSANLLTIPTTKYNGQSTDLCNSYFSSSTSCDYLCILFLAS